MVCAFFLKVCFQMPVAVCTKRSPEFKPIFYFQEDISIMEALQFPNGAVYMIVCKAGDRALRIAENDPQNFEKCRVVSGDPNPQDLAQLWMVDNVNNKEDGFEILNCVTGKVFDEEKREIRLRSGRQKKDQLFMLEDAQIQGMHKHFWIKTSKKGTEALELEGLLRYKSFEPNNESQLFRFEQVNNCNAINSSAVIINNLSGKALDIPGASFDKEEKIVQWEINRRFNQRWFFHRHGQGVIIQSLLSGFCLDIAGESRKPGSKIITWDRTGGANQVWIPEQTGQNLYRFRSAHESSLFLSIKKESVEDGGLLEANDNDCPSIYWRVEGQQP